MKVLFTLPFLTIDILITLGSKVVLDLFFKNRTKTNQWIAIEGSNVTLITDAKFSTSLKISTPHFLTIHLPQTLHY